MYNLYINSYIFKENWNFPIGYSLVLSQNSTWLLGKQVYFIAQPNIFLSWAENFSVIF